MVGSGVHVLDAREGVQAVVKPGLLVGNVAQRNSPSALVNQVCRLAVQNEGSLTAVFACGASSGRGISRCSILMLHVLKSVLPYVKVGKILHTRF
jgi:hypothetical protein